jgi:anti-sigma regulatory factor (Ser/Thr protein kinase)
MLPAEPAAVGRARALLERTLEQAGIEEGRRFEALLVASELVSNAVVHGSEPGDEIGLEVSLEGSRLRIGVRDAAHGATGPVRCPPTSGEPPAADWRWWSSSRTGRSRSSTDGAKSELN